MLKKLKPNEPFVLYVAIKEGSISAVLIKEIGTKQCPVYYVN